MFGKEDFAVTDAVPPAATESVAAEPEPMRSLHTSTFPQILAHFGMPVLVTAYQVN